MVLLDRPGTRWSGSSVVAAGRQQRGCHPPRSLRESLPTEPLTEDTPALKKFRTEWPRPAPARGLRGNVYEVRDPVEKPDPRDAPSDLTNIGRYVLTPDLFLILEDTPPDSRGEIRLLLWHHAPTSRSLVLCFTSADQPYPRLNVEVILIDLALLVECEEVVLRCTNLDELRHS